MSTQAHIVFPPGFEDWPDARKRAWALQAARHLREQLSDDGGSLSGDPPDGEPPPSGDEVGKKTEMRVPKGDSQRGRIHPGEWTAEGARAAAQERARGRQGKGKLDEHVDLALDQWVHCWPYNRSMGHEELPRDDKYNSANADFEREIRKIMLTGRRTKRITAAHYHDIGTKANPRLISGILNAQAFVDHVTENATPTDAMLYRGVALPPRDIARIFKKGGTVSVPLSSWTPNSDVTEYFTTIRGQRNAEAVVLRLPPGVLTYPLHDRANAGENEHVLMGEFEVKQVVESPDGAKVVMLGDWDDDDLETAINEAEQGMSLSSFNESENASEDADYRGRG